MSKKHGAFPGEWRDSWRPAGFQESTVHELQGVRVVIVERAYKPKSLDRLMDEVQGAVARIAAGYVRHLGEGRWLLQGGWGVDGCEASRGYGIFSASHSNRLRPAEMGNLGLYQPGLGEESPDDESKWEIPDYTDPHKTP